MRTFIRNIIIGFVVIFAFPIPCFAATSDTDVPDEVVTWAEYYESMYGIDKELIQAICFVESSYQPTAQNGSCIGIMQVNTAVHKDILADKNVSNIWDVRQNICCGTMILYNIMQDEDDIYAALMKYNGDKTGLEKYRKTGEVSSYALKVVELMERY